MRGGGGGFCWWVQRGKRVSLTVRSDLRQVPDNQEVFVARDGDDSIVFDILELCAEAGEEEAAAYHFADIADANASSERTVLGVRKLDTGPDTSAYILQGLQKVSKFGRERGLRGTEDVLLLTLVCARMPSVATDLVLSYNRPLASSSGGGGGGDPWSSSSAPAAAAVVDPRVLAAAEDVLRTAWENFQGLDWGLFGIHGSPAAETR
ncbi:MAG: hypothetical protein BJ554DRAFT_3667 [Olpidium bornovanus]|uniref:Ran guanine nucleotide release factor n=1 Tax=Olpidium bornovanus TaxID=278681 RepID=A0A8H8DM03_9FUNG|nr:MAG: hypothetical protein BJ554DRAFT_3667 [Olpidium bornovanus]